MPFGDPAFESVLSFYRQLLKLNHREDTQAVLEEALRLIVEATGSAQGYLELRGPKNAGGPWSIGRAVSDQDLREIRSHISHGILSEVFNTREIIQTASAFLDPRFMEKPSVRARQIEAVVCAPLGADKPLGALYLQRSSGAGPYTDADMDLVRDFAHYAAPFIHRLATDRSRSQPDPTAPYRDGHAFHGIVGRSEALAAVFKNAQVVAPLHVTVLLTGASGTGKTMLARAIHNNSPRASQPFVELNCAALSENLIENELFGHEPGAYTGATTQFPGKIEHASGGTLFLDEISALSLTGQAKLLQVLQSGIYYRLGSDVPMTADFRLIAATNIDLQQRVSDGSFREDLFYRINVLPIRLPTLQERAEDIYVLAEHFRRRVSEKHNFPRLAFSPEARGALASASWPGNVRELSNVVERGLIRAVTSAANAIGAEHLFPGAGEGEGGRDRPLTFEEATRRFQRQLLLEALESTNWNRTDTAKRLGLTRSHIYNLIKTHGLREPDKDEDEAA